MLSRVAALAALLLTGCTVVIQPLPPPVRHPSPQAAAHAPAPPTTAIAPLPSTQSRYRAGNGAPSDVIPYGPRWFVIRYAKRVGVSASHHVFLEQYYVMNQCHDVGSRTQNEFARQREESGALAEIQNTQPPVRMSLLVDLSLDTYNAQAHQFPLSFPLFKLEAGDRFEDFFGSNLNSGLHSCAFAYSKPPNPLRPGAGLKVWSYCLEAQRQERFTGCGSASIGPYRHSLPLTERAIPPYFELRAVESAPWAVLPMDERAAEALLQQLPRLNGRGDRTVYGDLVFDIVPTRDPRPFVFDYKPVALFLWADPKKTRFIGAVGQTEPGARPSPGEPITADLLRAMPASESPALSDDAHPRHAIAGEAAVDVACPQALPADADRARCADQVKVFANGLYWGTDHRIHAVPYGSKSPSPAPTTVKTPDAHSPSAIAPKPIQPINPE